MREKFVLAYFRYLNDIEYKSSMIECGLSAMMEDFDSENIILLSGADSESDQVVVETFLQASKELGIFIPEESENEEWIAEMSVRYLLSDSSPLIFDQNSQFYRNILVGYSRLKMLSNTERFIELLGRLVKSDAHINDYEVWLNHLNIECKFLQEQTAVTQFEKKLIFDITDVITGFSYGAIEDTHYKLSYDIAQRALQETN